MMQQYEKAKEACGDALLFFRMGDFYELFHDDARKAAKLLGLTLTSRDKASKVPMAGFPHHQLDGYMGKLIKLGLRVAVCEQVEDPKEAKGLVKREITQIVSPGTVADEALLDPAECNYLAAVAFPAASKSKRASTTTAANLAGVAWAELSTGRFFTTTVPPTQLADLLARISPKEILVASSHRAKLDELVLHSDDCMLTERPDWGFGFQTATELLKQHFDVASLDGFGLEPFGPSAIGAAGAIIEYLRETQRNSIEHFNNVLPFRQSQFVEIDSATWRSLELSRTIRHGTREGSLLGVIDRCKTPMGSRLLGEWISNPLTDLEQIATRHDAVGELVDQPTLRNSLREYLNDIFDLQRLLSKVATGRATPRDISCVGKTLAALPALKAKLTGRTSPWLCQLEAELDLCSELRAEIDAALIDPCPAQAKDSGFIREGYDSRLDELRSLAAGGKQWIANYQQTICEQTGIPSLKVGFNKVFGYYLEVTHLHRDKIPADFIRKQTLKNAERYITPELKEYEEKVLSADEQAQQLEHQLFQSLRELVKAHTARLKSNAEIIATLDTLTGLAQLASEQGYCRPTMVEDQQTHIVDGRHPVLDIVEPLGAFIPNDTHCCPPENTDTKNAETANEAPTGFLHLITGPNMAGKSTYIRQVALISLMGQVGSFVPAKSATLGIVDKIFARVGASDELAKGQSTFMVEMTETARILNTATKRSLVILDEIGRGTSTYDGVSLAWAIVEFLHDSTNCRTLFATHYHELTKLEDSLSGVVNYNVAVKEWEDKIVFLHKIVPGGADRSYGIHVSRLAGVPNWVNQRAEQILEKLESSSDVQRNQQAIASADQPSASSRRSGGEIQMTLFGLEPHPLLDKIRSLEPTEMTPMNALEMLHQWQQELTEPVDSADPAVSK
jgi:DNA mismatch repair protein MutS